MMRSMLWIAKFTSQQRHLPQEARSQRETASLVEAPYLRNPVLGRQQSDYTMQQIPSRTLLIFQSSLLPFGSLTELREV